MRNDYVETFKVDGETTVGDLKTVAACDNAIAYLDAQMSAASIESAKLRAAMTRDNRNNHQLALAEHQSALFHAKNALRFVRDKRKTLGTAPKETDKHPIRDALLITFITGVIGHAKMRSIEDSFKADNPELYT